MMITQVHIKQVSVLFYDWIKPSSDTAWSQTSSVWHVASWGFKMLNQDYE